VHHPNGSRTRKWVAKHFACTHTASVRNDDIVTSVKMPFTEEDAINVLRKDKQYSSWCLLKEFPNKKCTRVGLDQTRMWANAQRDGRPATEIRKC